MSTYGLVTFASVHANGRRSVSAAPAGPVQRVVQIVQILAATILLVLIIGLLVGTVPMLIGGESFVVLSGSMEPTIGVGDLTVVIPVKPTDLQPGDIITYRTTVQPDVVVTHRLMSKETDDQGRLTFETRGDANQVSDSVGVDSNTVLGRVAYSIPKLGYLVEFARQPQGKLLLVAIPALLLVLDYALGWRRRRGQV